MANKASLEDKKNLLNKLHHRCLLVKDYFIERTKRKGRDSTSEQEAKNYLIKIFNKYKDDVSNIDNLISGYREAIKDDNHDIRSFLSTEEQVELKQWIRSELGSDTD